MDLARLHIHDDPVAMNRAAADRVLEIASGAIDSRGAFSIALAGGSTPRSLYQLLATPEYAAKIDWSRTHVFFGDERCVPLDHPDSNYRMASEALLQHVPIPAHQVHPLRVALDSIRQDAARYAALLNKLLPKSPAGFPRFDLILLGLGPDGHTASLFPNTCILRERKRPVAAVYVGKLSSWRVSLTIPVIEQADRLLFLTAGAGKAQILQRVFCDPATQTGGQTENPERLPVQILRPGGEVEWHVDRAAAQYLKGGADT